MTDPERVTDMLEGAGILPEEATPTVEPLGGGVSNHVLRVQFDDRSVVVKRPRDNLAVEDDWPAELIRVHNEATATRFYADICERVFPDRLRVPELIYESHEEHIIVTSCAPDTATPWKRDLLSGSIDPEIASVLGAVLGTVHATTEGDESVREAFESYEPFEQLRLDPYHATVARRHPDVAEPIRTEMHRLRDERTALVHGDYSPKNVLVDQSTDPTTAWLLDFEVAHWGDPAFDVAFMLNHLLIKSIHDPENDEALREAAEQFRQSYVENADRFVERNVVCELAILLLARVDGKSPVEYIDEDPTGDIIRTVAVRALETDMTEIATITDHLRKEVASR